MEFRELAHDFDLPARNPEQPRPVVPPVSSAQRWSSWIRRRGAGRRLAYLDSTFPWMRSGFRYHEALALHELAPDTLFFSMWELVDPFPAPVHSIADFPGLAASAGITDAYGVFSLFLEGLAGTLARYSPADVGHPTAGPDISAVLARLGIRLHGSIYPGGGFVPSPEGFERLRALSARMETVLSYVPEVLENLPAAVYVDQAFTETSYYARSVERWDARSPLVCLFAADAPRRKGIDIALEIFAELDPDRFHLHVVGPHQNRRGEMPEAVATFHGWCSPEQLRTLHRHAHLFLSPVHSEPPGPRGSYQGVTDGFPTQAAADAMSSGCLLVSGNPAQDHRVLTPGVHYIEQRPDADLWRATLRELAVEPARARTIADAGAAQVRARMDVRHGAAQKLALMGLR